MQSNERASVATEAANVKGVSASSGGLVKATVGAAVVAGAILTFIWLPAEHGIDPTGVGHVLGLTEMGHIKEKLHSDADVNVNAGQSAALRKPAIVNANAGATGGVTPEVDSIFNQSPQKAVSALGDSVLSDKLDAIQAQLSSIEASVGANSVALNKLQTAGLASTATSTGESATPLKAWLDEVSYTLTPSQGIEVKLVMDKGATAEFEWTANGAVVNHDTHGDGSGQNISYEKGRAVPGQAGELTAAFNGNHGWYWRNRTGDDVVVTLRTRGDYKGMVLP